MQTEVVASPLQRNRSSTTKLRLASSLGGLWGRKLCPSDPAQQGHLHRVHQELGLQVSSQAFETIK